MELTASTAKQEAWDAGAGGGLVSRSLVEEGGLVSRSLVEEGGLVSCSLVEEGGLDQIRSLAREYVRQAESVRTPESR
ncbi:MAG TPA: hypothetical protein H9700_10135 [Candidatus Eisenbergiella intestinipullorum]|nr:hypothetical protein [Candidatus Eisenbergiella intestinipullorum]